MVISSDVFEATEKEKKMKCVYKSQAACFQFAENGVLNFLGSNAGTNALVSEVSLQNNCNDGLSICLNYIHDVSSFIRLRKTSFGNRFIEMATYTLREL